ncbi:hypothetical protein IQ13_1221 [Lacibacter cauensis]|uniref:Oxygen tolerance protein BatD n=1 Tax=Lacibacter cauensis TaxID=510947 RepID=A0A562SPA7_9BACT|nr:hypothetical protein [Lacibacter cauensis]TWI83115.1 hypothetical protein IQ13_1221 [Lacibacter cauensis]
MRILLTTIILFFSLPAISQDVVDVTEQTIRIGGFKDEEILLGFAKGDKIIFNFKEVGKKEMKEIEILEYPSNSKFSDYKTHKIENKTISVNQTGVYVFRFKNSAMSGRICQIKIQRIPSNEETRNFNTQVTWETKQETTYKTYTKDVVIGYDTLYTQKTKRELKSTERKELLIFDKTQRVHSTTNDNGNKTSLFFTLPVNELGLYKTKKVVSWAYWVGVGEEANQAWKQNSQSISKLAKGASTYFVSPLGALALGAVADLLVPKIGEDVSYAVSDQQNRNLFLAGQQYRIFDQGKGVAGFKNFNNMGMCQGTFFILLSNDNIMQGIDVTVKVVAIIETNEYEEKSYSDVSIQPKYEKKTFSDPIIVTKIVPVVGK